MPTETQIDGTEQIAPASITNLVQNFGTPSAPTDVAIKSYVDAKHKRVTSITSSSTPTPNVDTTDVFIITALSVTATFAIPTGTPLDEQQLIVRIKDNGSPQTLAWNSIYRASPDLPLPLTTTLSKTVYLGFQYNLTDNKFDLLALLGNI